MKKLTVNEIIKNEGIILHKNKINLIIAPAGSGKTYYVFNTLLNPSERSVYLCDTSNLKDSVLKDEIFKDRVIQVNGFKHGFDLDKYNCTVMTYAKWFYERDKPRYADVKTIVCDEIHNLYKYKDKFDDEEKESTNYAKVIQDIHTRAKSGVQVVGFTATHERIKRELPDSIATKIDEAYMLSGDMNWNIINLSIRKDIKRLRENFVSAFNDITQINYWFARTNLFKYGKKCLIYTDRITTAKNISNYINETFSNLSSIALWSCHNKKYPLDEEQRVVRQSILETGVIPEGYQILIINGAYETGINILDEDIEIAIINNSSTDTIIQERSRVRKDIELLMYRVPQTVKTDSPIIEVPEEYLNRKLVTTEKKELIKLLNLKDCQGRAMGWNNFKKALDFNQYEVIDDSIRINKKKTRVSEIKDKLGIR